jgi:head-tail adaptor
MLATGKRDRRVVFYPRTVTEDAAGLEIETDGTPVPAFAMVRFGTGAERREAAAAGSHKTATFRVLSTLALRGASERWQIAFMGVRWGINDISPVGGEASEIEFTATRVGA